MWGGWSERRERREGDKVNSEGKDREKEGGMCRWKNGNGKWRNDGEKGEENRVDKKI